MIGVAHTLRYVPMREDLQAQLMGGQNAQRRAVESLVPGEVLVIEARDEPDAGTIGDIYVRRAMRRGAAGVVTDGALRDTPAIRAMDLPVYHRASHAATFGRLHLPLDHQLAIACAGVTVLPGDVVVGDGEGVVIVPAALAAEVGRHYAAAERTASSAAPIGPAMARASAVGSIPPGVRWNRSSPNACRSRRSALLVADWVSPSRAAARVTWRSAASASNTVSRLRSNWSGRMGDHSHGECQPS